MTVAILALLLGGAWIRIAHARRGAGSAHSTSGQGSYPSRLASSIIRETEVATGLVASLVAGLVVAGIPAAREALGGWMAAATGVAVAAQATTVVVVTSFGTLVTELARRGIARTLSSL